MKPLSKLFVGSVLIYPSKDPSSFAQAAKAFIRYRVKQDLAVSESDRTGAIEYVAKAIERHKKEGGLEAILSGGCLVPVPRHTPLLEGALWPARRICEELRRVGIGDDIQDCVERTKPVNQSSTSAAKDRPGLNVHYESLRVKPILASPKRIVLVDDVVTRGTTLIACARRLQTHFPNAEFVAFTYARIDWDSRLKALAEMFAPRVETIEYDEASDSVRRD